jgi:hypothetical protein
LVGAMISRCPEALGLVTSTTQPSMAVMPITGATGAATRAVRILARRTPELANANKVRMVAAPLRHPRRLAQSAAAVVMKVTANRVHQGGSVRNAK